MTNEMKELANRLERDDLWTGDRAKAVSIIHAAASAEPVAWHCPACEAAVVIDDSAPDAEIVVALANARATFEAIRLILIKHLNEPERSAFWKAVQARDDADAALAKAKGGSQPEKPAPSQPTREDIARIIARTDSREMILATSDASELHHVSDSSWREWLPHADAILSLLPDQATVPIDLAEECAKIAESHVGAERGRSDCAFSGGYDEACRDIAKAIRDTYGHE